MRKRFAYFLVSVFAFVKISNAQHFSVSNTLYNYINFENKKLNQNHVKIKGSESLTSSQIVVIDNASNTFSDNDLILSSLSNLIVYYDKNDYKKCINTIIQLEKKMSESDVTIENNSLFSCVKFLIYNHFNLRADEEKLGQELSNMPNIPKYCLLYTIFIENCCFYDYISKNKTEEFITLSQTISNYDFIKTLSLLINNKKYSNVERWITLRDSCIDAMMHDNQKNKINSDIEYLLFKDESGLSTQLSFEKIVSLNDLGYIARKKKDFQKSIDCFNTAISLEQKCPIKKIEAELYTNLGLTYTLKKNFDLAETNYQKALDIFSKNISKGKVAELKNIIAKNNFLFSKSNAAILDCNQSLSMSIPENDYKNISESYFILSEVYYDEGDFLETNKYFKLYTEYKKLFDDELEKQLKNKDKADNLIKDFEIEAREKFKIETQKSAEYLRIKLASAQKEKEILEMQREAELREATIAYTKLDKEKSSQALALIEQKLLNKKKEIEDLENQNKLTLLENSMSEKKLELAQNRNYSYFQSQVINELKVAVIQKNQRILKWGLVVVVLLLLLLVFFLVRSLKNRKEIQIQNFKLSKKNQEIELQRKTILVKNKEIIDSINYALKIQTAMLPTEEEMRYSLGDIFVFFCPKDIVSGDFFWFHETRDYLYYATADCTGHGVPGGFMSMLSISLLNDIVKEKKIEEPCDILDLLSAKLIAELKQTDSKNVSKDGMDICLCRLDKAKTTLSYSGANNDLWLVRNNEIMELKADNQPVGFHYGEFKQFSQHTLQLKKDDRIYTFTDGYADQFGGKRGKKFKYKNLKNLFLSIYYLPANQQRELVETTFKNWKNELEQVDDILIIGLRI